MGQLQQLRQQIDQFLRRHPQSPLPHNVRYNFEKLDYYDEDAALRIEAPLELFDEDEPLINMQTSTGAIAQFRRYGRVQFEVDGQPTAVTIYSDAHGHELFLPFRDTTSGHETYGAGRYLDDQRPGLVPLPNNHIRIDFNYSYNPYCAYNEDYSCPLPPRENWLDVPIRAGEKAFV